MDAEIMKKLIKAALKKAGYELHRIDQVTPPSTRSRSTMTGGLQWLSKHDIPIRTVLDVGASNGCWSQACMDYFPNADYVLFEPQPVHSNALDVFEKSHDQRVLLVKQAVGASEGQTYFDASDPFGGALASSRKNDHTIQVKLTTIDGVAEREGLQGPFLLKLDTHGYERSILAGATKTIDKTDIMVIEAYNHRITNEAFLFWELCDFLSAKGFRPIDIVDVMYRQHDDSLWQIDLFFVRSSWAGFNYIEYY